MSERSAGSPAVSPARVAPRSSPPSRPGRSGAIRILLAALAVTGAAEPARAATVLRCRAAGQGTVTIRLDDRWREGRRLSCISGSFAVDLTPCAPEGAFSLSAPFGAADIIDFAAAPEDFAGYYGGVVGFTRRPHSIAFTGGLHAAETGMTGAWRFAVDLTAGRGRLARPGLRDVVFLCRAAGR